MSALGGVALLCGGIATFMLVSSTALAIGAPLLPAIVVGQCAMVGVAVVAIVLARDTWPAGQVPIVLGLARPRARVLVGAALVGCSAWVLTSLLADLLTPRGGDDTQLTALVNSPSLAGTLVAAAVVPAICEEIMFRGLLARGLATRLGPGLAIVISAALFSGYHLKLVQLAPTFLFGLALAVIAIRANSILPTMLAHGLNNTCAILVSRSDALALPLYSHPVTSAIGAALLTTTGLAIVLLSPPARSPA